MAVCQNLVPLVNIKIAGKWMFIPPKNGIDRYIDPYPSMIKFSGACKAVVKYLENRMKLGLCA